MKASTRQNVARGFVSVLVGVTAVFLVVVTVLIVGEPNFPLSLGLLRTTGRTGLLLTAVPALIAIIGLVQLSRRRRNGSILVGTYSAFWGVVFLSGLPAVWNARRSFCVSNFCITSPWVGRLTVIAIAAVFLGSGWWSLRQAGTTDAPGPP